MNAKDNSRTSFDRQAATYDIDRNGFPPRPVAIDVLRHDGIATLWMTTLLSSEKVKHLRKEPKAGICYVAHKKKCESMKHYFPKGPDDPDYCILRFEAAEATLWIDRKFEHITL